MTSMKDKLSLLKALIQRPQIIKAKPAVNWFLLQYMRKFKIKNVGGNLIMHSHLPPLNSKAYTRFVNEHLVRKVDGPTHAQIGITNACPQKCAYCYNRDRKGTVMDSATIKQVIQDLKRIGVVWLGLTGGEPLLKKDVLHIIESAGDDCAVKLFTTGCTLTHQMAQDLKNAGLFSVSVSLDHWRQAEHDHARGYEGAFQAALKAIELFKEVDGIHVGVSAVLSKEMIVKNQVEEFVQFLIDLEIHEAWLSETKPSVEAFWKDELIITEDERLNLIRLQDKYNKEGKITINYLGHFEGSEHFGCNAGQKMVYVDAFGEVSPCVFTPMTLGNVQKKSVIDIYNEMKTHFPSENRCFINKNYRLVQKFSQGQMPMNKVQTLQMLQAVEFGPLARFFQLHYGKN
jgi:MoaA/NifB/PqqE/SkfB family radical SAM enzyme